MEFATLSTIEGERNCRTTETMSANVLPFRSLIAFWFGNVGYWSSACIKSFSSGVGSVVAGVLPGTGRVLEGCKFSAFDRSLRLGSSYSGASLRFFC